MKKLLFTLAMLLSFSGASFAQSWSSPGDGTYNHETFVHVTVTSNADVANFVLGAFIAGECRATATAEYPTTGNGTPLWTLRVWGDKAADLGKTINFKVYDPSTNMEYTLTNTLTFDGESHGPASSPIKLALTAPTSYSLHFTEAEMGKTYDLRNYVTVTPDGATLPDNLMWNVYTAGYGDASAYATINNNILTPLQTGNGLILSLVTNPAGGGVESTFNIVQYATGINLLQTSITVNREETYSAELDAFMHEGTAYELVPAGSTANVGWETEDATILQWSDHGYYIPIKGGTTRIRPYINKADASKIYPSGWITVKVVVPVTGITIDPSIYGGTFKANVGDTHLYERLVKMITILPADATDKSYTITMNDNEAISKTGANTFKAIAAGLARFTVTANGANDPTGTSTVSESIDIQVLAVPAVTINSTTLGTYKIEDGNPQDITMDVHNNVTVVDPDPNINWEEQTVSVSGTSVTATDINFDLSGLNGTFTAVSAGTTTVTINLRWPNYDDWGIGNTTASVAYKTDSKSFQIVVTESATLASFNVAVTGAVAGQTGTITFTPQPVGAEFDVNTINFRIQNGLSGQWLDQLSVTQKSATTDKIVYEFTSTIPGMVSVEVTDVMGARVALVDPNATTTGEFTGFEIGYPVNFSAGWQWRSNTCGVVAPDKFESVYTTANLQEIRTQRELLYNDPSWGFYGTLMNGNGLLQGQCYKLKMKNAQSSVLYGSSVANASQIAYGTSDATNTITITLNPGWNWIGSPYLFNRPLNKVLVSNTTKLDGAVIVGRNGSAELGNGTWQGDMNTMGSGLGYIIKNPTSTRIQIDLPMELTMNPGDEGTQVGVKASGLGGNVWKYDDTRFMDNMTMVCTFEDLDNPERYSIGAFVGDECRGEGILTGDKAFVTVHCDGGELVNFKLYDTWTGEMTSVKEVVAAQTRIGSLKAPFVMHADTQTTGINAISGAANQTETYDLTGRRVSGQQHGVSLQRTKNGNFRKVVVK
jgi:hypothetical protein